LDKLGSFVDLFLIADKFGMEKAHKDLCFVWKGNDYFKCFCNNDFYYSWVNHYVEHGSYSMISGQTLHESTWPLRLVHSYCWLWFTNSRVWGWSLLWYDL